MLESAHPAVAAKLLEVVAVKTVRRLGDERVEELTRNAPTVAVATADMHVLGPHPHEETAPATAEWLRRLREQLPDHPGVVIEDKKHTVTIHYRAARDRGRAIEAIGEVVDKLPGARVVGGVEAVNLLPRHGPHKGAALQRALRLFGCTTAIYVGDDATDEDAFGAVAADRILGIRIGSAQASQARYHLAAQDDIDTFLRTLLTLRPSRRLDLKGGCAASADRARP